MGRKVTRRRMENLEHLCCNAKNSPKKGWLTEAKRWPVLAAKRNISWKVKCCHVLSLLFPTRCQWIEEFWSISLIPQWQNLSQAMIHLLWFSGRSQFVAICCEFCFFSCKSRGSKAGVGIINLPVTEGPLCARNSARGFKNLASNSPNSLDEIHPIIVMKKQIHEAVKSF